MLKTMFSKGSLPALEKAVSFHSQRHRLLASNIANVNTPYYQARDLSETNFHQELGAAINQRRTENPREFHFGPSRGIGVDSYGNPVFQPIWSRDVNIMRHDGNNIDIDMEMSKLSKNAINHNALLTMLNHELKMIEAAISGRIA